MANVSSAKLVDKLHSVFTGLLDRPLQLPVMAPAFFIDDLLSTVAVNTFEPVNMPTPFAEMWIVYESNNPPFGTITNIVLIQGRNARLWTVVHGVSNNLRSAVMFDMDDPSDFKVLNPITAPHAVRETIPELRLTLDRINNNATERTVPPALARLNAKRAKKQAKKLPPYIVVTQTRRVVEGAALPSVAGAGHTVCAHNRRGHWRTYRATGRKVWVRDCAIHGGTIVPRDYRVQA